MITWYVQMDTLGNFWLNAETGEEPYTIRAAELIPRKVWNGPGDQQQVLACYAARAQETINSCKRLATAC